MANKELAFGRLFLFAALFALSLPLAFGQNADTAGVETTQAPLEAEAGDGTEVVVEEEQLNYYIDRSSGEPRFIQRLLWQAAENVFRYEVVVEYLDSFGTYTEVERVSVQQAFAEFSLIAGKYRYRLRVYDLLDELCLTSEWREFDIIRALQPELTGFSPGVFYLDEDTVWEISVRGQNLLPESEFILVTEGSTRIVSQSHTSDSDGRSAVIVFSGASLTLGEFQIYVRNPGGLDTLLGTFTITNKKRFEFNVSLGYAPILPLYGYLFKDGDLEAPFPDKIYPIGGIVRFSFSPLKRAWGYLGIELAGSFSMLSHDMEYYTTKAFFLNTHLSLLYQKYFFKRILVFNARVGAGFSTLMKFYYEYNLGPPTEEKTELYPSALVGVSLSVFFKKPFYADLGADFIHIFAPPDDGVMPGFIRPHVTVGVNF